MTEREWLWDNKQFLMVDHLRGTATARKLRLYVSACVSRIPPLVSDDRFRGVFAVLARSADGLATSEEVEAATAEARSVAEGLGAYTATYACWVADDRVDTHYYTNTLVASAIEDAARAATARKRRVVCKLEARAQAAILRDIFGNPFRPVAFSPSWRTDTAVALARTMYDAREFSAMPILADALQDAGCDSAEVLDHCRGPGPHVRGCFVVDLVLEKE